MRGYQDIRTFHHQVCHGLHISNRTRYQDAGEAETAREVQQSAYTRPNPTPRHV